MSDSPSYIIGEQKTKDAWEKALKGIELSRAEKIEIYMGTGVAPEREGGRLRQIMKGLGFDVVTIAELNEETREIMRRVYSEAEKYV